MSPRRGIPTSRAYWELKADQLLNRVFDPAPTIEVELCDTPVAGSAFSTATLEAPQATAFAAAALGATGVPASSSPMAAEQAVGTAMQAMATGIQTPVSSEPATAPMAVAAPMAAAASVAAAPPMAAAPPLAPEPPQPHHQPVAEPPAAHGRRVVVPSAVVSTRIPWHRQLGDWVSERPGMALAGFAGTCLLMGASSLLLLGHWNATQQALRQERNLLLVERLRALGPAATAPAGATAGAEGKPGAAAEEGVSASLPPPPPEEPWMEELATLPQGGAPAAAPLRVPVSSSIASPAPASSGGGGGSAQVATASAGSSDGGGGGDAPQLVGVVQVPGRGGSAIFQMGGTSTTAGVGESIGGTGWRLRSATGDSAVIERGGQQRRISISSGF
ncbi:hypothetical protein [Synechococcus sp. CS-1328]|uniref:hypothetical protein n=1 Tax=Synechococcus sp. CS-1328 TaxID=2847976 RepID=UPI00223B0C99|nr:hypothetical protein [Synechococcus sp. CS-1328]MCT0225320.1 hypothetical protein [Synechococcus sp. CS-1328]